MGGILGGIVGTVLGEAEKAVTGQHRSNIPGVVHIPNPLKKASDAFNDVSQKAIDYVIKTPKGYVGIDGVEGQNVTAKLIENPSLDTKGRAVTPQDLQRNLLVENDPAKLAAPLAFAQKAEKRLGEILGRPHDADLDDNAAALKGKGARAAVPETREELITELGQRLKEVQGIKRKEHPELFAKDPTTGKSPIDNMKDELHTQIDTLEQSQTRANGMQAALTEYNSFMNPSAAPKPTQPSPPPKPKGSAFD